jgi:hypothetical protein
MQKKKALKARAKRASLMLPRLNAIYGYQLLGLCLRAGMDHCGCFRVDAMKIRSIPSLLGLYWCYGKPNSHGNQKRKSFPAKLAYTSVYHTKLIFRKFYKHFVT